MSEINAAPGEKSADMGLLATIIFIFGLMLFGGIIAYSRHWFSPRATTIAPGPVSSINITIPTPMIDPVPFSDEIQNPNY